MWKVVGSMLLLGGAVGVLYDWFLEQRAREKQLDVFLCFLQRSYAVMQTENIKVIDYFSKYTEEYLQLEENAVLVDALNEISKRLTMNIYPNGQMVWESVFQEDTANWNFEREVFQIVVQAGNGFFSRSRLENIRFLEKSIKDLELQKSKIKEINTQKRKVWVPVGILGSVMLVIIFL